MGQENFSVMFGGIGKDEEGRFVESIMKSSGVVTRYAYHEELPTGRCIALIKDTQRALVACIGAAAHYDPEHLFCGDNLNILHQVKMIYIEGFFITHSFPVAVNLIKICNEKNIPIGFNFSSEYVIKSHFKEVCELIKSATFIFGNEKELKAWADLINFKDKDMKEVALYVRDLGEPKSRVNTSTNLLNNTDKTVVVTRGANTVFCVSHNTGNNVLEVPAFQLDQKYVSDTTGAGDSFVGGFLAAVFKNKNIETCVKWGCWTAGQVIQQVGHQIPSYPPKQIEEIFNSSDI